MPRNKHLRALHSSSSHEWFTPARYIEAARTVLGGIDLDPASCALANETVQAAQYYDEATNGLEQSWHGRVWLNPPYGYVDKKSSAGLWSRRMIEAYRSGDIESGILCVTSVVEKKWFQPLWDFVICLTNHRIRFYNDAFPGGSQPAQGSAFVYFGNDEQRFIDVFSQFGPVARRCNPSLPEK